MKETANDNKDLYGKEETKRLERNFSLNDVLEIFQKGAIHKTIKIKTLQEIREKNSKPTLKDELPTLGCFPEVKSLRVK